MKKYENYKLCYIMDGLAYFTSNKLEEQWGDDWDDAPYEHNAEEPYCEEEDEIIKIYFISHEHDEPKEHHYNSPYSVEMINNKETPWLKSHNENSFESIWAGISFEKFIEKIIESEGEIFLSLDI